MFYLDGNAVVCHTVNEDLTQLFLGKSVGLFFFAPEILDHF